MKRAGGGEIWNAGEVQRLFHCLASTLGRPIDLTECRFNDIEFFLVMVRFDSGEVLEWRPFQTFRLLHPLNPLLTYQPTSPTPFLALFIRINENRLRKILKLRP